MTAPDRPPATTLLERVAARQAGERPEDSAFLAGRPGLALQAAEWDGSLPAERAAVPERVEDLIGPGHRLARLRRLALVLAVLLLEGAVVVLVHVPWALITRRPLAPGAAHRLRRAFEHLGPSYVKLGQFISSGRGLFPDVLVDEFATCRDRCPRLPWRTVRRAIEAELGPLEEHFAHVEREPLAAASIAQVHAATLHDGTDVVVKVQRPGIARQVEAHIRSMPAIATLVVRSFPDGPVADPVRLVRLFATTILEELDFRLEAQNMLDIGLDLEAAAVDDVVVPRPVPGLVTERVLVMERLEGHKFDDLDQMRAAGIDTAALLLTGIRSLVEGATVFGRFHGDLHAGNVVCLPDGRFGLIDFGICARLDDEQRAGLQRLLVGIATRDVRGQVRGLDAMGALPDGTDRRRLIARMMAAQDRQRDQLSVDDLRAGAPRIMRVFAELQLELPPGLVLFFKDVLYLNGSTRLLAPDLDLLSAFAGLHRHFDGKYGSDRVVLSGDPYGPDITEEELAEARAHLEPEDDHPAAGPGAPAPTAAGIIADRIGSRAIPDALVPLGLFLATNTRWGLAWAIAAVTTWSLGLTLYRRRRGRRIGFVLPIVVGFILLRGIAGIVTRSDAVYFGPAILNNFLIGGTFLLSVLFRTPLIGLVARAFYPFPAAVRRHPTFHRVFRNVTLAWATFLIASGTFQVWLLATQSTNTFVTLRAAVGWPVGIALLVASIAYPRRVLERDPEIVELFERGGRTRDRHR